MVAVTVPAIAILTPLALLDDEAVDTIVTIRATLRSVQLKRNMRGENWASLQVEQAGRTAIVVVFVRTFAAISPDVLHRDAVLQFDARVLRNSDGVTQLTPVNTPAFSA